MRTFALIFAQEVAGVPAGVSTWLSCLFWVLGGVLVVLKIVEHFRKPEVAKLPQPLQVQYAQRLATHDELQQLRRELESSQTDMARQIAKLGEDNEVRTRRLHDRIEETNKSIAGIPHQIIALLRDTKGLHQ